jgi:Uma2 family endonuclease
MVGMTVVERHAGPWTRAQRDALPDDGRRYELLDGMLVVTPAPVPRHQVALTRLLTILVACCPEELRVLPAPLDVVLDDRTIVEPDILVAPLADFSEKDLPVPPLLAVEVLSPGNRGYDLVDKRERYERAGIPSYWVIDPEAGELIAWDLRDGSYVEVARVRDDEAFRAEQPFPVTVVPAEVTRP